MNVTHYAAEFHGLWENLVYDIEIKQRVSQHKINVTSSSYDQCH